MGALYLDGGFDICRTIIIKFLEEEIDFAEILYNDNNYKDQLLRHYHKNKWSYPTYTEMKAEGPLHCRIYTIGVKDNENRIVGIGVDHSKRKAEQIASKKALVFFGVIEDDNKEIIDINGYD
jgi:dsRNA-specific ribonuclease